MTAWAVNWVLSRPEAAQLLQDAEQMIWVGPLAGAVVGFFNLAKRQGWGLIVAVANGAWTGLLSIAVAGILYLTYKMTGTVMNGLIADFRAFLRVLGQEGKPLIESLVNYRLIGITIAATTVVGVVSECLHWSLVKLRRYRGEEDIEEAA
jgi:hypothetical protein